jgi:threonine dehydrogenase-like Zn-dependent dehydrogenase
MTWLSDTILHLAGPLALVAVFTLPALEASTLLGIVVPGELALVLGGVLAHQGRVPLWATVAAGAVTGDSVGYAIGRTVGERYGRPGPAGHDRRRGGCGYAGAPAAFRPQRTTPCRRAANLKCPGTHVDVPGSPLVLGGHMRAITVIPMQAGSARLDDIAEPSLQGGDLLVQTLAVGVCGTDLEISKGEYGWAPPGRERLVLGHESLGRVLEAPGGADLAPGDLVVGIVREPDPVPCASCAAGEWDMCRNGRYTEHGIKELDGFMRERYRIDPSHAVRLDPALERTGVLLEPTSVVAKAWDHIERIAARAVWDPEVVLVTGAGPIGLLAALLGVQRGLEVHVLDQVTSGPKPALVADLGATYHTGPVAEAVDHADVIVECTGVGELVLDAVARAGPDGIVCLTGVSAAGRKLTIDPGALNRELVLDNMVVFGSVNANRRHYQAAAEALAKADPSWLERLITRRVPLDHWSEALQRRPDDVKAVIDLPGEAGDG